MKNKFEYAYLNQNVIVLIVGLFALGFAEYYNLYILGSFGVSLIIITSIFVFISMFYYTKHYIENKDKKNK